MIMPLKDHSIETSASVKNQFNQIPATEVLWQLMQQNYYQNKKWWSSFRFEGRVFYSQTSTHPPTHTQKALKT
jgi:hypothetical protein